MLYLDTLVLFLRKACISGLLLFMCVASSAQNGSSDSTEYRTDFRRKFSKKWNMQPHSPLKATCYSAMLPGLGQGYNKKYWKIPIVYAAVGTTLGFIIVNNKNYQYYKTQYIASADGDPNTVSEVEASNLFEIQEQYHRWRDVSYMCLGAAYVLQLIDANVDGHFFYYDISKDVKLQWTPTWMGAVNKPGVGLQLNF
jgi:Family of unknown function (DUF5683)